MEQGVKTLFYYSTFFIGVCFCAIYKFYKTKTHQRDMLLLIFQCINGFILLYALSTDNKNLVELTHNIFVLLLVICAMWGQSIVLLVLCSIVNALAILTRGYYKDCLFVISRGDVSSLLPQIPIFWVDLYFIVLLTISLVRIINIQNQKKSIQQ